jgi:hypothetical protein
MNKDDIRIGTHYLIRIPDSTNANDYRVAKGKYLGRALPKPGNKRSRGHNFETGGGDSTVIVTIDATRVISTWKEYENTPGYLRTTVNDLTQELNRLWRDGLKEYAELLASILGLPTAKAGMPAGTMGIPSSRILTMSQRDYGELGYQGYPYDSMRNFGIKLGLDEIVELLRKADLPVPQFQPPTHVEELLQTVKQRLEAKENKE